MKSVSKKSHKILYPVNRTSRRFLKATNKIRLFFQDNMVSCIPCVEKPFDLLLDTRKLSYHRINIIEVNYNNQKRLAIKFHGSIDKRKKLLADYLRSYVLEQHNAVLLPKSISNFIFSNQVRHYIVKPKFKSIEEQMKLF